MSQTVSDVVLQRLSDWSVRRGEPKFEDSQDIPNFPYTGYAESLGLGAVRIDQSDDIGSRPGWSGYLRGPAGFVRATGETRFIPARLSEPTRPRRMSTGILPPFRPGMRAHPHSVRLEKCTRNSAAIEAPTFADQSCREQIRLHIDRQALHLAQVLQKTKEQGPRGPDGAFPEAVYASVELGTPSRRRLRLSLLIATGVTVAALIAWSKVWPAARR